MVLIWCDDDDDDDVGDELGWEEWGWWEFEKWRWNEWKWWVNVEFSKILEFSNTHFEYSRKFEIIFEWVISLSFFMVSSEFFVCPSLWFQVGYLIYFIIFFYFKYRWTWSSLYSVCCWHYADRREDASNLRREACHDGTKGSRAHLTSKVSQLALPIVSHTSQCQSHTAFS